jgi:hypothetical protein
MIWFFDREGQKLRYEIRHSQGDDRFELVVTYPEGRVAVEQLADPAALLKRCAELAESLRGEGWKVG